MLPSTMHGPVTVTAMRTVPLHGGVPLSVTVTEKLSVPVHAAAGVERADPVAATMAVPWAGAVLTTKVWVWPVSGALALTCLGPAVFWSVWMGRAVGPRGLIACLGMVTLWGMRVSPGYSRPLPDAMATDPTLRQPAPSP